MREYLSAGGEAECIVARLCQVVTPNGKLLDDAVEWCRERGVEFYAVNKDYPEEDLSKNQHFSRKIKADVWIDDRNIGGLPDWGTIYQMISEKKTYEEVLAERFSVQEEKPRKKWWQF